MSPFHTHTHTPTLPTEIKSMSKIKSMSMKRKKSAVPRLASPLTAFILLISSTAFAQLDRVLPPSEQAEAGQALAQKWRDAMPAENAEYKGALKIRADNAPTETIPLTFKIIAGTTTWQSI